MALVDSGLRCICRHMSRSAMPPMQPSVVYAWHRACAPERRDWVLAEQKTTKGTCSTTEQYSLLRVESRLYNQPRQSIPGAPHKHRLFPYCRVPPTMTPLGWQDENSYRYTVRICDNIPYPGAPKRKVYFPSESLARCGMDPELIWRASRGGGLTRLGFCGVLSRPPSFLALGVWLSVSRPGNYLRARSLVRLPGKGWW